MRLIRVTKIVIVTRVLFLKTLRSIIKELMSTIGPKIKKARIDPRLKVPTNDKAKKASTDEQIDTTKAKTIRAITDSDGEFTKLENKLRGINI